MDGKKVAGVCGRCAPSIYRLPLDRPSGAVGLNCPERGCLTGCASFLRVDGLIVPRGSIWDLELGTFLKFGAWDLGFLSHDFR